MASYVGPVLKIYDGGVFADAVAPPPAPRREPA